MEVYVATVPLRYEVMAVASTQHAAERAALSMALRILQDAGWAHEFKTQRDVREYHGVCTTKATVGGQAVYVGDL